MAVCVGQKWPSACCSMSRTTPRTPSARTAATSSASSARSTVKCVQPGRMKPSNSPPPRRSSAVRLTLTSGGSCAGVQLNSLPAHQHPPSVEE